MEGISKDLVAFMKSISRGLQDEYNRIQIHAKGDPGTAGDQGELNWAAILRDWLPPTYRVVTKGRLINHYGIVSPQIDIFVLRPHYPNYLVEKKHYFAAGVAAIFECKTTLKAEHIKSAFETSKIVHSMFESKKGDALFELNNPILYGILAHSHSWNKKNSKPFKIIEERLLEYDNKYVSHPKECLDFICISDLATWKGQKTPISTDVYEDSSRPGGFWWRNSINPASYYSRTSKDIFGGNEMAQEISTPVGTFLSQLITKLSIYDATLKDYARSLSFSGIWGGESPINGGYGRSWSPSILSDKATRKIIVDGFLLDGSMTHMEEFR